VRKSSLYELEEKRRPTEGECSEGRRSYLLDGLGFRLHLERTHVAHRAARLWSWLATLVLVHLADRIGNLVDGSAAGQVIPPA
jgi:hypothetical protein